MLKTKICYKSNDRNILEDTVFRDSVILQAGKWDQQDKHSNIYYSPELLKSCANNWKRNFIYLKHTGRKDGTPEDALNIVGFVDNPHFDVSRDALVADLRIVPRTQTARDAIGLIKSGIIKYLSPEVWTSGDKYNYYLKATVPKELTFNGVALVVDNPACKGSRIGFNNR